MGLPTVTWHEEITNHDRALAGLVGLVPQAKSADRIKRIQDPNRRGLYRLTALAGDTNVAGSGDNIRCELYIPGGSIGRVNTTEWYAHTYRRISGPLPRNEFGMYWQWHTAGGGTQAQLACTTFEGYETLRVWNTDSNNARARVVLKHPDGTPIKAGFGRDLEFVVRIRHSIDKRGVAEVYCNGVLQYATTGWTNFRSGTGYNYPKFGGIYTNNSGTFVSELWGVRRLLEGSSDPADCLAAMVAGFPSAHWDKFRKPGSTTPPTPPPPPVVVPPPPPPPPPPPGPDYAAYVAHVRDRLEAIEGRATTIAGYSRLTVAQREAARAIIREAAALRQLEP